MSRKVQWCEVKDNWYAKSALLKNNWEMVSHTLQNRLSRHCRTSTAGISTFDIRTLVSFALLSLSHCWHSHCWLRTGVVRTFVLRTLVGIPCVVRGESSANYFERPSGVISLLDSRAREQAILVYLITRLCNGVFVYKFGHKLASNEARKEGLVTVTDFDTKGTISEVRVHAGLYLVRLDHDRSPNAVRFHVGTTQVDFESDRPHPAVSPPGDLFITMVKETVILYKKDFSKKEKKSYLSLIWRWSEREMTARLPATVSIVQTWFYM